MAPNTQIGKIFMDHEVHSKENMFGNPKYDRGGAFIEDLQSHVFLEFGARWLHLGDYSDIIDDTKEFFTTQMMPSGPIEMDYDGLIKPVIRGKNLLINPISRDMSLIKPIIRYKKPTNFDGVLNSILTKEN